MKLDGATVLLTGATGGIGHANARRLKAEGATLVMTGRNAEVLAPLATELEARKAITMDRGEIGVAPPEHRFGARLGSLLPAMNATIQRQAGAADIVGAHRGND